MYKKLNCMHKMRIMPDLPDRPNCETPEKMKYPFYARFKEQGSAV